MAWVQFRARGADAPPEVPRNGSQGDNVTAATSTTSGASATPGVSAQTGYVFVSYGGVILLTWLIAFVLYKKPDSAGALQGEALLAVGLFLAQGLERFLDPFSRWAGGATTGNDKNALVQARDAAFAAASGADLDTAPAAGQTAAEAQAALNQFRANSAVVLWAAACVLGVVLATVFDLRLLSAVGARAAHSWDIAISGIAIGSATKPLHDLIEALKATRNKNDGAPAGSGTS